MNTCPTCPNDLVCYDQGECLHKFQHAGLDWHPHTPGDPMPCLPDTLVRVLMRSDLDALCDVTNYETSASIWDWNVCPTETMAEIIGWHPIEN